MDLSIEDGDMVAIVGPSGKRLILRRELPARPGVALLGARRSRLA